MAKVERLTPPTYRVALIEERRGGGPRILGSSRDERLIELVHLKVAFAERLSREREAKFWGDPRVKAAWRDVELSELDEPWDRALWPEEIPIEAADAAIDEELEKLRSSPPGGDAP